jgi:hypothetical protein
MSDSSSDSEILIYYKNHNKILKNKALDALALYTAQRLHKQRLNLQANHFRDQVLELKTFSSLTLYQ